MNDIDIAAVKGLVMGATLTNSHNSAPQRFQRSYTALRKDESIKITKADKSNALVILDKNEYDSKVNNLLQD